MFLNIEKSFYHPITVSGEKKNYKKESNSSAFHYDRQVKKTGDNRHLLFSQTQPQFCVMSAREIARVNVPQNVSVPPQVCDTHTFWCNELTNNLYEILVALEAMIKDVHNVEAAQTLLLVMQEAQDSLMRNFKSIPAELRRYLFHQRLTSNSYLVLSVHDFESRIISKIVQSVSCHRKNVIIIIRRRRRRRRRRTTTTTATTTTKTTTTLIIIIIIITSGMCTQSDTSNNRGKWNNFRITQTIPQQHTRKARN